MTEETLTPGQLKRELQRIAWGQVRLAQKLGVWPSEVRDESLHQRRDLVAQSVGELNRPEGAIPVDVYERCAFPCARKNGLLEIAAHVPVFPPWQQAQQRELAAGDADRTARHANQCQDIPPRHRARHQLKCSASARHPRGDTTTARRPGAYRSCSHLRSPESCRARKPEALSRHALPRGQ